MAINYDVTEELPYPLSNPLGSVNYIINAEDYDVAIGAQPFFLQINDSYPYTRSTAPYRKQQFDTSKEPGEQSLSNWWLRSQSSFHAGAGIKFYDPSSGETVPYRFTESQGVNVWTKGQVTLLKDVNNMHITTTDVDANLRPQQHLRSIRFNNIDGVLLHDGYDVDKVYDLITATVTNKVLTSNVATLTSAGHGFKAGMEIVVSGVGAPFDGTWQITTVATNTFSYAVTNANITATTASGTATSNITHFIDYNAGIDEPVYAICDDGVYAYWVTNKGTGAPKLIMYKKLLTDSALVAETQMFQANGITVTNAVMEYVKDRIVLCVNNAVYEVSSSATSLPTPVYTNPNTNYVYTSISASGPAIYTTGFAGNYSTIQRYTLTSTSGSMPTLTQAIVAAEFGTGEVVHCIYYYIGYMMIGTNKGVRVATINDQDGSLSYGPLIFETNQPVYAFIGRDRFVYCTTGQGTIDGGLTRIDLGTTLEGETIQSGYANQLRFAYAYDLFCDTTTYHPTTAVCLIGTTNRVAFTTAYRTATPAPLSYGGCYFEHLTDVVPSGYIKTGFIRYSTVEDKVFKTLKVKIDNRHGGLVVQSNSRVGNTYTIGQFSQGDATPEMSVTYPTGTQEYLSFTFNFTRSGLDSSLGPTFTGYQLKSLPAIAKQRIIQYPLACFDTEKDKWNNQVGYEGAAYARLAALEAIESAGDTIRVQDFRTGETFLGLIEELKFITMTPTDKRFSGFGGVLMATIRSVS